MEGGRENETTVFLSLHLFSINSEMPCSAAAGGAGAGEREGQGRVGTAVIYCP